MYVQGRGHAHFGPGTAMVQFNQPATGLGCACNGRGMGCGCAGYRGMGLFESGFDFTQWSWPEWGIVLLGGYMLLSTIFTTGRAAKRIAAYPGERRKRRAARLRKEASELSRK